MISKSSFVNYWKCPKHFWLHLFKKEVEGPLDSNAIKEIYIGNIIGNFARNYFKDTYNASSVNEKGEPIYDKQIKNTKDALIRGENCIAEASFSIGNLFCAVDLLKKNDNNTYSIYEVKSSFDVEDYQLVDVTFQKYVLEKYGIKVDKIYILHPNREYKRGDVLNIKEYFVADDVSNNKDVLELSKNIENLIKDAETLLKSASEPSVNFSKKCIQNNCPFYKYCHRNLPLNPIGSLNQIKTIAEEYYAKGLYSFDDFIKSPINISSNKYKIARIQLDLYKNNKVIFIEPNKIKEFIRKLRYPLYHLDFETTIDIIPEIKGRKPKEEIPTQYSLHIEHSPFGKIEHKEYLADSFDCVRDLAERLILDIPQDSCIIAFHSDFEKRKIKYLAEKYPDLEDKLLNLEKNIVDLELPFREGWYYDIKQCGSTSIKVLLPVLCPEIQNAYHTLPGVKNGSEASIMFYRLINEFKGKPEYNDIVKGMLEYCCLDTYAMIAILNVLRKIK